MDDDTKQALVEWVNSFPLSARVTGFSGLSGGRTIWEVLHDVDPSYFAGDLPESADGLPKTWLSRWENLKYIYQALTTFLFEESKKDIPKSLSTLDLKMIAMESDAAESSKGGLTIDVLKLGGFANTAQLLKLVLLAAISSPRAMDFIGRMPNLSIQTQNLLKEWIVELGESPEDDPNGLDECRNGVPPEFSTDQGLVFEERMGRLMAENDKLKKVNDELRLAFENLEDRLEHSQVNNSALQHRLSKAEDRVRANDAAQDAIGSNKLLESKVQQQEEVIASLEGEVSGLQANKDSMQKAIDKLKASAGKAQKLQDAFDELKTERDNLVRKANTAEKYKQKLQAGGDMQKENLEMRSELAKLRQDYETAKQARQQVAGLQKAVDEYKRVLPKIEQECHELQMMKKRLEFDNATLAQRCDKASQQHNRDQATIASLNEKSGYSDGVPASPAIGETEALDSELTEQSSSSQALRMKVVQLQQENKTLQSSESDSKAKVGVLEQMLDDVRELSEERERRYLETYKENLILQSSFQALQKGEKMQDLEIFKKTQDWLAEEQEVRTKLEQQLKRTQEELQESRSDLSLIDKDKLKAIEEIKKQQSVKLTDTEKENQALKRRTVDLETDRAGLQALLRDHINSTKEKSITNDDLKNLFTDFKAALPDRSAQSTREDLEKYVGVLGCTVRETSAQLSAREEKIKEQNAELQNLRNSLQRRHQQDQSTPTEAATSNDQNPPNSLQQTSQVEYIANLERENRLMATAYHTLAGRLQMNNVVLQRRNETPNAWLNKQRRLVNQQVLMPRP